MHRRTSFVLAPSVNTADVTDTSGTNIHRLRLCSRTSFEPTLFISIVAPCAAQPLYRFFDEVYDWYDTQRPVSSEACMLFSPFQLLTIALRGSFRVNPMSCNLQAFQPTISALRV
ncbi:hypothetical protein N7456_011385 [Penicillium angulare]|uniref:Uncharacterized protein n=1 Tax=Penicillium angulare TaxID=116970 RepID=A0A9W9ETU1_9EURO|nr:hypothetical protein N7456_011385 [Penicillium angulare]